MASVTHRVSTASSTDTTSYASGAFTPAVGDLLVAFVTATATVAAGTMTQSLGQFGFTRITTALKATSADTLYLFVSNSLCPTATSQTVTFDCTGDAATGTVIQVASVAGMVRANANAVRQSAVQSNGAAAGTPGPAFGVVALTANCCLGLVGNATNPATMTAPASWSEANDTGFATPTTGAEYAFRNSGATTTTISWGGTSASAFGAIIVELDISVPASPALPTQPPQSKPLTAQ